VEVGVMLLTLLVMTVAEVPVTLVCVVVMLLTLLAVTDIEVPLEVIV
jgi:hypothetical protein